MVKPSNFKYTTQWVVLALLLALPIVIIIPHTFFSDDSFTLCLYTNITGHNCWGCGMTRAVVKVMQFDFIGAWNYNPRVVVVFPILLWLWAGSVYRSYRKIFCK